MPKPVGGQGKHGYKHTGQTDDPGAPTIGGGERSAGPGGPRDRTIVNIKTPSQDESDRKTQRDQNHKELLRPFRCVKDGEDRYRELDHSRAADGISNSHTI